MRNIDSLKNNEFQHIYKNAKSYANRYLVMYVLKMMKVRANWEFQLVKRLVIVL